MEGPLWEQSIPFKKALAIAVVQKRKYDAALKQRQDKCAALEDKVADLEKQLDAQSQGASTWQAFFSQGDGVFGSATGGSFGSGSETLSGIATSIAFWSNVTQVLPASTHLFLAHTLEFTTRKRLGAGVAAFITSPLQATLDLLEDTLGSTIATEREAQLQQDVLATAVSVLGQLCAHPAEVLAPADFDSFQNFAIKLLSLACMPVPHQGSACAAEITASAGGDPSSSAPAPAEAAAASSEHQQTQHGPQAAARLLSAMQNMPGTGLIVLGCAAHSLHASILQLKAMVIGELVEQESAEEQTWGGSEINLACYCTQVAAVLQSCLRELPGWTAQLPPDPSFLRGVAGVIMETSEACQVVGPAHAEVGKQGSRCASLLVSALQNVSSANVQM